MSSMTFYHSTHSILLETGSSICVPTIPVDILLGTLCLAVEGEGSASLVPITALPSIERGRTGAGTEFRKLTGTGKILSTVQTLVIPPGLLYIAIKPS